MADKMNHLAVVKAFVVENFLYGEEGRLAEDTSFLESGIVDSTGIMELVGFLEKQFGIVVDDDDVVPENMDSLARIDQYLLRKLSVGKAPGAK
jgi:acyl carrier protein